MQVHLNYIVLVSVVIYILIDSVFCRKHSVTMKLKTSRINKIKNNYIVQPLDHFKNNTQTLKTWKMRYAIRTNFWRSGGPVFIHIGGQGPMHVGYLDSNRIELNLVRETHGVILLTEHRYYGKSLPKHSHGDEEYKYLSSRQSLADIARFIRVIKRNRHLKNSKVVAIGGSYAGNLAAWMRQLHPELVDAAWASSAPVLAKLNFFEYYETLGYVFRKVGGNKCYEDIQNLFKERDNMFNSKCGLKLLKRKENICPYVDLTQPTQRHIYFRRRMSEFDVQDKNTTLVADICLKLSNASKNVVPKTDETSIDGYGCDRTDFNKSLIDADNRAWLYQTCTEFGYMQTTSSAKQPFGNNIKLDFLIDDSCKIFGNQYDAAYIQKAIGNINKLYGGLNLNVTNVVFVNGGLDPWHKLGILEDISPDAPAIFMENTHHCEDLKIAHSTDLQELIDARNRIKQLINKWISK